MKTAVKTVPVYSADGQRLIGQLECGDEALILYEGEGGAVIAYILGFIRPEHLDRLKDSWESEVTMMDKFLAYAASQVGCLYVWGAQGQTMTPELIKKMEDSDKDYKRALALYNKHVQTGQSLVGYDCSGLIVKFLLDNKLIGSDTTANGLYFNHCTAIGRSDLTAGDLVFRKYATQNKMYHVGVYMGDGTVVHAKGRDDGVVREGIGQTAWNRYGRLKVFASQDGNTAVYTRLLKVTKKPYIQGDDVRAVQQALVEAGYDPKGVDGVYGPNTEKAVKAYQAAQGLEVDGIVGPKTWGKLFG